MPENAAEMTIRVLTVTFLGLFFIPSAARGSPFVAGFDRFFRENDSELEIGGRVLLSELSCTACHTDKAEILRPKRGPVLLGVADRLQMAWRS